MITCQAAPLRRGAGRRYTIAVRTPAFLLLRLALGFGVPGPDPSGCAGQLLPMAHRVGGWLLLLTG